MQECEVFSEELLSNELIIEGEYASESTMLGEWNWSQHFGHIWYVFSNIMGGPPMTSSQNSYKLFPI